MDNELETNSMSRKRIGEQGYDHRKENLEIVRNDQCDRD